MGHLFSQMASMIAEQSEVILRIEDDVEVGLAHTIEGHKHLEDVYAMTKGNRSIIIKIFLILIFFIFLFLVWT
jgi:syntaxin 5